MYRIIIADDEDEVREGIKLKTEWAACGFELVGDFDNGREVFESMETLQPDVIITDISMPFMDGLQLADHIAQQYRDVKIVFVTGFEDFKYAKQAIKLNVKDYLLKPINAQEFMNLLLNIKQELDEERKKKEDLNDLRIQLNQSFPLFRERFLDIMITTRMPRVEIERKFRYFHLSLSGPSYIVLVADIDEFMLDSLEDPDTETELLRFAAFNILKEVFEDHNGGIVFRTRENKIIMLYSGGAEEIQTLSHSLAEKAKYNIEKYFKIKLSCGIGRVVSEIEGLAKSYLEALSALDYRFLVGRNKIVSINDLEYGKSSDSISYNEWEKKLLSAMKTGNSVIASETILEWMEDLKSSMYSIEKCYGLIHKFLIALMHLVEATGFDHSEVFQTDPFSQIIVLKTIDDVEVYLIKTCKAIITYLSEKRTDVTKSQMLLAEAYILDHYGEEVCSINQVCNHIYMSISYFSAQFKQHTGKTFVEYLTRIRLEKAKELLHITQLRTYDIASRVGYEDPQYFSVIFKKNTGMTPKEYRALKKGSHSV
jgi:two-component system response regulator YesN